MKKILILVLLVCMTLLLGCSADAKSSSQKQTTITSEVDKETGENYFNITADELHAMIDETLVGANYDKLTGGEEKIDKTGGKETKRRSYYPFEREAGGLLSISQNTNDDGVTRITIVGNADYLKEEDFKKMYFLMGVLMGTIDPDKSEEITDGLRLFDSPYTNRLEGAEGANGDYIYQVDNGSIVFTIKPL
ncbi:hypothetical protein [Desulfitobacterium sp. PCE1]|uniref:hypothetical protein n=1 Tax=Desulfitobacterium sp. PCE1 TaxID=146907 RepID=UPI00036855F1|nr:hypothetical protein [Desulfitobacterium sp. PCE1]